MSSMWEVEEEGRRQYEEHESRAAMEGDKPAVKPSTRFEIHDGGPVPIWECNAEREIDAIYAFVIAHPRLASIYLAAHGPISARPAK